MNTSTLRKLLNLASSDHDQEALSALRQVQKLVGGLLGDALLATDQKPQTMAQRSMASLKAEIEHWEAAYQKEHARAQNLYARYVKLEEELEHRRKEVFRLRREVDRFETEKKALADEHNPP